MDPRDTTLGDLLVRQPGAAPLLESLGLDYCCGGHRTLEEACSRRGLDAGTVAVLLEGLRRTPARGGEEPHDVGQAPIADLCDHIVLRHHEPCRTALARAAELLATVVRVHGKGHGELADLQRLFSALRTELEDHMLLEEAKIFPACRELGERPGALEPELMELLEHDHEATGRGLVALRELSGGYAHEQALCGTHRALLDSLSAIELDLHQHIHEENNILFPRVRAQLAAVDS
jgi:regulator of cell morphogenesis and NO signaling